MNKSLQIKEQLAMFDTYHVPPIDEKIENARNIINLREELKYDIPNTTYLTHGIHNVYPAKFIPQVPRFVINKFNLKRKIILDPFAGSGTTAVESILTGNSNISNDINPITRFLVEVKTIKLNPPDYFNYMNRLNYHINSVSKCPLRFIPRWGNLDYWYPEDILSALTKIWGYIHNIDESEGNIKNILKVSALYLSRKYSYGEDESPKLFKSKQKTIKMKELINKFREFGEELLQNELLSKAKQYLKHIIQFNLRMKNEYKKIDSLNNYNRQFLMVMNNSLEELGQTLPEEIIDCIITSPPYIYAQEYFRSTKIDMYWLDMVDDESIRKLTKREIGQKVKPFYDLSGELSKIEPYKSSVNTIKELSLNFKTKENILRFEAYFNDMLCFVKLSAKLLVKKGILAILIGEPKVFGSPVNVKDIISEMLSQNNFKVIHTFFDIIKSRHLSKNRLNENPDGISGEWLIIGEKS
ncbi:MAG: hypothetical protein COS84_07360 [Armatimonadetes bacterium CG07_land_8_20_14_0_80_40_9]|nr:MAG: hypothetical protein COS84_07360 [Armatimonadetes bacterium CG07_land_8_20_14_0_80_40_9]